LSARSLPKLPLSVGELYRQGQTNTDAEPFAEHFEVDEVVHGLEGESFFISSKASNFDALVPSVIGPAPSGVIFAIPNRHTLLYAIVDQDDWMTPVIGVTQAADSIGSSDDVDHPGGLLSPYSYYWAPDGTVERLGGRFFAVDGEPAMTVRPGEAFSRYVNLGSDMTQGQSPRSSRPRRRRLPMLRRTGQGRQE
jgi:hypothetical protein